MSGFTQITPGPSPVQICPPLGEGVSVTIYNSDPLNIVTIGTTSNVAQDATNAAPLQPLTNGTFPADTALYAVAPAGTAALVVIPEGGQLSPSPGQIALNIAETGLAKDSTLQATNSAVETVTTTLGTPAQNATVAAVTTAVGTVETAVGAVTTTLGTPAQNATVAAVTAEVSSVNSTLGTPAQNATVAAVSSAVGVVNTTLGAPAQNSTVAAVSSAVATVNSTLGSPAQNSSVTAISTSVNAVNTTLGSPAQSNDIVNVVNEVITVNGSVGAVNTSVGNVPTGISNSGVPLLSRSTSLLNMGNTTIAAGATINQGPFNITQIGYEIFNGVQSNSASSTIPAVNVTLTWSDSATGNVVAVERWHMFGGNGSQIQYTGTGPTKGDTLNIAYTNQDTVNSATVKSSLAGNSRVYVRDDWRQLTTAGIPGQTLGTYDLPSGVLLTAGPSVPAGGQLVRPIGLYSGLVNVCAFGSAAAADSFSVSIGLATATPGLSVGTVFQSTAITVPATPPSSAAGGVVNSQVNLPRGNCIAVLNNLDASAAQPININITIVEQLA